MMRVIQCTLLSLLLASTPAYPDFVFNLTPGVTPVSHAIYQLHLTLLWICIAIGLVVFGVLFYALLFHRKSKGAVPAQFHEHLGIELAWSILPFIILILMAIPATSVLIRIRDTAKPDLTVKITGYQWKWHYEYLDSGITFFSNNATSFDDIHNNHPKNHFYLRSVDHPLVLPIHKKIRFLVTSNDVVHSWWVSDLGVKQDAIPGFIIEAWTRINRPGTYHGQCAELCGLNHAYMPIVVNALPEQDFNNWVIQQKGGAVGTTATTIPSSQQVITPLSPPSSPAAPAAPTLPQSTGASKMQQGQRIFNATCAMCHQPNGEGLPPTYPALKGSKIATGSIDHHLSRVLFGKPGTAMQAFKDQFSDEELADVITYERNSWGNHAGSVEPEQIKAARAKGPLPEP